MAEDGYRPLTPLQAERKMRELAHRLEEVVDEQSRVGQELAAAEADWLAAYHTARLRSTVDHPERKVGEHESAAQLAAVGEFRVKVVLAEMDKSLRNEAHSIRAILSSIQSNMRAVANLTGDGR